MSIRYVLGSAVSSSHIWLLSRRWFPLLRTYSRGTDWVYDLCRIRGNRRANTIFDVGANLGQTSRHLLRYFPSAQLHAFELARTTAQELARRLAGHANVNVHHLALSSQVGTVRVALQSCSETNSLAFASSDEDARTEEVTVSTVDAFCTTMGIEHIDVLKTDAQGSDLDILRGAEQMLMLRRIDFVFCEAGIEPGDKPDLQNFAPLDHYLKSHGFKLAGFYDQWCLGAELHSFNVLYFHPAAVR